MTAGTRERIFRIILAEDDPDQMRLYRLVLERQPDLEVVAAVTNGAAAVEAFRATRPPPDLVILDARMPRMTGIQATEAIRLLDADVRILVISAEKLVCDDAIVAGASEFMPKLFDIRSFLEAVRGLCASIAVEERRREDEDRS